MYYEEYCQVLDRVDSDPKLNNRETEGQYVVDAIKEILKAEHPDVYKGWENKKFWKSKKFNVNHLFKCEEDGYTPCIFTLAHVAAGDNKINALKALLAAGADINATEDVFKRTPLHWASGSQYIDINTIKFLLENGAKVNAIDIYGETPLHLAIRYGNESIVNALLAQEGINVNIADIDGMTPLHQAVFDNQTNIVNALLQKGAILSWKNKNDNTPLHLAVARGYKDIIRTLLLAGADTSLKNHNGNTPMSSTKSDEIKNFFKSVEDELHNMKNKKIGDTDATLNENAHNSHLTEVDVKSVIRSADIKIL